MMSGLLFSGRGIRDDGSDNNIQPHHPGPLHYSGLAPGEELISECEVVFEEEDNTLEGNFEWCETNPKHSDFIRLENFSKEDLPSELRKQESMDFIKRRMDLTVRIRIPYTTTARPNYIPGSENDDFYSYMHHKGNKNFTRNGTGLVTSVKPVVGKVCPCPDCRGSDQPETKHHIVMVRTVTHNLYDNSEAEVSKIDCFFNHEGDEDVEGVIQTFYGLHLDWSNGKKETMYQTDICDLVCVTHNTELADKLSDLLSSAKLSPTSLPDSIPFYEVIISHPHGCAKRISVGNVQYLIVPMNATYKSRTAIQLPEGVSSFVTSNPKDVEKKEIVKIDPASTFTLPRLAKYAMKFYIGNPAWLKFPPGTKFKSPQGENIAVPDESEFRYTGGFLPQHHRAKNIVGGCAGTAGAMIYSNLMEDEPLTDHPHISQLRDGKLGHGGTH